MNAPDAYTNYGHALTHARPDQPFPQEALADELWIWAQGRFQRMKGSDFNSGDSRLDTEEGSHFLFTHDNVWPDIDEGRAANNMEGFWKGRFDSRQGIVTVLGPFSQRMRDIPNILMKRLMDAYPGAQIKRFQ